MCGMARKTSPATTFLGGTALLVVLASSLACHRPAAPPKPDHKLAYVRTIDVQPVPVAGRAP